MVVIYKNHEL